MITSLHYTPSDMTAYRTVGRYCFTSTIPHVAPQHQAVVDSALSFLANELLDDGESVIYPIILTIQRDVVIVPADIDDDGIEITPAVIRDVITAQYFIVHESGGMRSDQSTTEQLPDNLREGMLAIWEAING